MILHGDMREKLAEMEPESVDAIVCDPPYELGSSDQASPARILAEVLLPKKAKAIPVLDGKCALSTLALEIANLSGLRNVPRPPSAVPEVAVTLDDEATGRDRDVKHGDPVAADRVSNPDGGVDEETETTIHFGDLLLECADVEAFVDSVSRVGSSFFAGGLGVGLGAAASGFPSFTSGGDPIDYSDSVVGLFHDALAFGVGAGAGTENLSVPRVAAAGGAINLLSARAALLLLAVLEQAGAKLIRTCAAASGLPPVLEPDHSRYVIHTANGTISFDLLTHGKSIATSGFMGKEWDGSKVAFDPGVWRAALRVAKPGAHLVAFGGTRTYHRLACAIEDAGWELRDNLCWLYGSGFPKSHNVAIAIDKQSGAIGHRGKAIRVATEAPGEQSDLERPQGASVHEPVTEAAKQWEGWGTALKPGWEPIIVARKPLAGTVAANVLEHGTGGLNVHGCRIGTSKDVPASAKTAPASTHTVSMPGVDGTSGHDPRIGRWPANVILDPESAAMLDEQTGNETGTHGRKTEKAYGRNGLVYGTLNNSCAGAIEKSSGGPSRFFYTAKASRSEREAGLEHRVRRKVSDGRTVENDTAYQRDATQRANTHPTVKPVALMRWLVRLVTPPKGVVLDPFCGSGTTGVACVFEGFRFIGVDLDEDHVSIARDRNAQAVEDSGKMSAEAAEAKAVATGEHVQLGLLSQEEP